MKTYDLRADSPQGVAAQSSRLAQAVVGQIQRLRSGSTREVTEFAIDAWEKIATRDYVNELATRTIADASAVDVMARLRRDVLVYLNDCARIDRGAVQTISAARELLATAIDTVLRYS